MKNIVDRSFTSTKRWKDLEKIVKATEDHCYLCGGFVDASLPRYVKTESGDFFVDFETGKKKINPASPEIEHLNPIARGGDPLDRNNLRLVHAICNNKKGDKFLSEIDRKSFINPAINLDEAERSRRKRTWLE